MGMAVALLFSLVLFISSTNLYAASGDLVWSNYYDREGSGDDVANAVDARAGQVFAAGYTETATRGKAFTVRAYNGTTGARLWTSNHNWASSDLDDEAKDVVVYGGRVFAVGYTTTAARGRAFTVRAYNSTTGALLWSDYYNRQNNTLDDEAMAVASSGTSVFAAGFTWTVAGDPAFSVRAYQK